MAEPEHITFGWGAPSIGEQLPILSAGDVKKFDALNRSIMMCHLHDLITDSQRDAAIKKCTRQIEEALARARKLASTSSPIAPRDGAGARP